MVTINPWVDLKMSDRMVHPLDEAAVNAHNIKVKDDYKFLTNMVPEPFVGNVAAPVLLLMANPGATQANALGKFGPERNVVVQASIDNLVQRNVSYPLFHLDPKLSGTEGADWYRSKLRWLIEECGELGVANNLFTAELVPYHSIKWREPKSKIPTQEFTVSVVNQAISRGALILVARSYRSWINQIPQLITYPKMIRANSPMNASISPGNYGLENFQAIVKALK